MSAFKYGDVNYVPLFPRGKVDPHGRLIPTPENVHLTNLRDVVVSLADHRIQRCVRQNFINKNPIPGALFNGDAVLTNPDAIMPADYNAASLTRDIYAVKGWLEAAADLKPTMAKWFANVDMINTTHVNESMLVANDSQDLRVVSNAIDDCAIHGDITQYWMLQEIPVQMSFYGTYLLFCFVMLVLLGHTLTKTIFY